MQEAEKPKVEHSAKNALFCCEKRGYSQAFLQNFANFITGSFLQQPAVMLVESATARKSVSAGMPSSAKLVGRPISLINAASASIPAAAVSSSLPLGAMPQTFCAQRVNRAVPDL